MSGKYTDAICTVIRFSTGRKANPTSLVNLMIANLLRKHNNAG